MKAMTGTGMSDKNPQEINVQSEILTAQDVAELLRVTTRSLRRFVMAGQIPRPARIGRQSIWLREDLLAFLRAGGSASLKRSGRRRNSTSIISL